MVEHIEPSEPVAAYLTRAGAYQLDPRPSRDLPDSWTHLCPVHRDTRVCLDQDVTGDGWLHQCDRGCLPGEIIDRLRHPDWPPADPARVRVRGYVPPALRAQLRDRAQQASHELHTPNGAGRGWSVLDLSARLERLRALLDTHYPGKRAGRYQCPACGAPGDGHGLHIGLARNRPGIFIRCYACKQTGEIMAALGVTGKDLGWTDSARPDRQDSDGSEPHDPTGDLMSEVYRQRIRRQARRQLDSEERPPATMPEVLTLAERLARPRPPVTYRVDGWQPTGARVMLAAQFKAGKTTMVGNLVRCLVDGDPFLGRHKVDPVPGAVVVLDFEMSAAQLDTWLADQNISHSERVIPIPLRGQAAAFDIIDPAGRRRWADLLRGRHVGYLVLDCLRPVLDTLGLDEHRDAGRLLVALDALLTEAGISEAAVVHHMGHSGERSRGDSRIRDWPDVEWRLVRQDDEPGSARFVSAYGRDVDQAEAALAFDPATRHLSIVGGSRKDAAARGALGDVLALLASEPGLSGRKVEEKLAGGDHSQKAIRAALKLGVSEGSIITEKGTGRQSRGVIHSLGADVRQGASDASTHVAGTCVSAYIGTHDARTTGRDSGASHTGELGYCRTCGMPAAPDGTERHTSSCRERTP